MRDKTYRIAIRKRNEDVFWEDPDYRFFETRPKNSRYWQADPFLFDYDHRTYLFYESFDRIRRKGMIACAEVQDGQQLKQKIIIDEPFHLSFPCVFREKEDIYLMPESCGDNSILLYKAIRFPEQWERIAIKESVFSCDSIWMMDQNGKTGLITSEMFQPEKPGTLQSCYVRNVFYPIRSGFPHLAEQGTVIGEGDYGIRNAGAMFYHQNQLIRPGQDCTENRYGNGTVFFQVESTTPYQETEVAHLKKEELDKHLKRRGREPLLGTHTYNQSSRYETVDFSFMEDLPVHVVARFFCRRVCGKIKRILDRLNKKSNVISEMGNPE